MKREVDVLYGVTGLPNAERFTNFKTDLFANGSTPSIAVDTAVTNGFSVTAVTTTAFRVTGNATSAYSCLTGTFTHGLNLGGTITNGINVAAAASMTNFIKFNAEAGCVIASDVDPGDTPSDGGLGAAGCVQIDIGGEDFYMPYFASYIS